MLGSDLLNPNDFKGKTCCASWCGTLGGRPSMAEIGFIGKAVVGGEGKVKIGSFPSLLRIPIANRNRILIHFFWGGGGVF